MWILLVIVGALLLGLEAVTGYFEDLRFALGIVDDLNLNARIWSKV